MFPSGSQRASSIMLFGLLLGLATVVVADNHAPLTLFYFDQSGAGQEANGLVNSPANLVAEDHKDTPEVKESNLADSVDSVQRARKGSTGRLLYNGFIGHGNHRTYFINGKPLQEDGLLTFINASADGRLIRVKHAETVLSLRIGVQKNP